MKPRKIIVIGTLHNGFTPESHLKKVLEKYCPKQLLVEIAQEDINSKRISMYAPEIIAAYEWAKKKGVEVKGFDSKINVLNGHNTKDDDQKVIEEQKKVMKDFNWVDMNKEKNHKKLNTLTALSLYDSDKIKERQTEILRNIRKQMAKYNMVVIVTECGNLAFLEKNLTGAKFPFR